MIDYREALDIAEYELDASGEGYGDDDLYALADEVLLENARESLIVAFCGKEDNICATIKCEPHA